MNAIELSGWKGGEPVTLPIDGDEYLKELEKRIETSRFKTADDNRVLDNSMSYGTVIK